MIRHIYEYENINSHVIFFFLRFIKYSKYRLPVQYKVPLPLYPARKGRSPGPEVCQNGQLKDRLSTHR